MQAYARLRQGHMRFLVGKIGGMGPREWLPGWLVRQRRPAVLPPLPPLEVVIDPARLQAAAEYLQPGAGTLDPIAAWPAGLASMSVVTVPGHYRARPGRVLLNAEDLEGWGTLLAAMAGRQAWPERLIVACRDLYLGWQPRPAPRWVTCMPSFRRSDRMPELAWRIAELLDLPFVEVLEQTHERPPPTPEAAASAARLASLRSSLRLMKTPPSTPVLLVDGLVYTGLSLAWAALLLQAGGSGPVWPMVLGRHPPWPSGPRARRHWDPALS